MKPGTVPERVVLHENPAELELMFTGRRYRLSHEFLRVHSPSAEVRGHSAEQQQLQVGKRRVRIERLVPVGRYALNMLFSDGHNTGIYTWKYLYELCRTRDQRWAAYLQALEEAGAQRDGIIIAKG